MIFSYNFRLETVQIWHFLTTPLPYKSINIRHVRYVKVLVYSRVKQS